MQPNSYGIFQEVQWDNSNYLWQVSLDWLPCPMLNNSYVYGTIRELEAMNFPGGYAKVEIKVRNECGWSEPKTLKYQQGSCGGLGGGCPLCPTFSPNPVSDELTINFDEYFGLSEQSETYSVKLLDNLGTTHRQTRFSHRRKDGKAKPVKFNVSNLREGTYYLHIESNGEIRKEQIIIKRK